jgi:hypothetical protein
MLAYPPYALVSNDIKESNSSLSSSSSSSNKGSIFDYYSSFNAATKYLFLDTEFEHDFKAKDIKAKSSPPLSTLPLKGTNLSQATDPPSRPKHSIRARIIALAMRALKRPMYKIIAKTKISYSQIFCIKAKARERS